VSERFDFGEGLLARLEGHTQRFEVAAGRSVACDLRGQTDGARKLFWFHGTPSCRLEAVLWDRFAHDAGYGLAAMDRPGLGGSDPRPHASMTDVADDALRVADRLGWDRFSVAGGSGGGPFVLALAHQAPDRVERAVALACAGAFELAEVVPSWADWASTWAVRHPAWLRRYFEALRLGARVPESVTTWLARWLGPALPGQHPELAEVFRRCLNEVFAQGVEGAVQDLTTLHRPWGFSLEAIRTPVTLVAGTVDTFVPFSYSEAIARRIPESVVEVALGDGHFETIFDRLRLAQLLPAD
jgi:pimeloyl-ACP methyl ester carboxylesterase